MPYIIKKTDNQELKRKMLNHLCSLYKIKEIREPNHLSSYVGCLTKCFLDQKQTVEPTDEEVMLFALGYGLQDVLTPHDSKSVVYNRDGIIYRPDMQFESNRAAIELLELKTTRKSAKYHYIDEELPETWIAYMMGGCKITEQTSYHLIVLYMMGNYSPPFPQIYADTFEFRKEDIEFNWNRLLERKGVLDSSIKAGFPPEPYKWCYDWECKYCRYKMVCNALVPASARRLE